MRPTSGVLHPLDRVERRRDPLLHVGQGQADGLGAEIEAHEARGERPSMKATSSSSLEIMSFLRSSLPEYSQYRGSRPASRSGGAAGQVGGGGSRVCASKSGRQSFPSAFQQVAELAGKVEAHSAACLGAVRRRARGR